MITFKNLVNVPISKIHTCFLDAFSNYEVPFNITLAELKYMLERRGCNFQLSYGAFNQGQLVGFVLNGIGSWNGLHTAYDTGTGVISKFQGKGIAKKLFAYAFEDLQSNGIEQYLLEVIKTNTKAVRLYKELGLNISREFDYYVFSKSKLNNFTSKNEFDITFEEISNFSMDSSESFYTIQPSWQNNKESIERKRENFTFVKALINKTFVGFGIIEKHTGDIPQIAIHKEYRKQGVGEKLMRALAGFSTSEQLKVINIEKGYTPFEKLFNKLQLEPGKGQYEMILKFQ